MRPLTAVLLVLTLILAHGAAPSPAKAEADKLTASQIEEALAGNTVDGVWGDREYRSYFAPSGSTTYQPKGMPPDQGKWRVDEAKDQYCSWWPRSGWGCYDVYRDGDQIIWGIPGTGTRYPSTLLEGRKL